MLETALRSGWIFKRIRSKTKWAVEIARQKQFGIRPSCTVRKQKVTEPLVIHLNSRLVPERKAATQAKKMLKERSLRDKIISNEILDKNAKKKKRVTKRTAKHQTYSGSMFLELSNKDVRGNESSINKKGTRKPRQREKKVKRKKIRLNRKEKCLVKKFAINQCIVCLPRLEDISKPIQKTTSHSDTETSSSSNNVNKRKTKRPKRVFIPGASDRDPIVVSDDDSDVEIIAANVNVVGTSIYPIILNDDDDADRDYNDSNFDPNDADVEEDDSDDDIDHIDDYTDDDTSDDDSLNESTDDFYDDDDDDESDYQTFSKVNSLKTYEKTKRNVIISPAILQPKKITVAPAKFFVPSSFRSRPLLSF